jgi:hypothetical protein
VATVDPSATLRRGFLVLAGLGVVGTSVELATLRHWNSGDQIIPWLALAGLGAAVVVLWVSPTALMVRAVRAVAVLGVLTAVLGMWEHVHANYESSPLDRRYSATWDTLSVASRWWKAITGGVGPSPLLAPAVLVQVALCLLFAAHRHPALRRRSAEATDATSAVAST